jgi:hypothetical protein
MSRSIVKELKHCLADFVLKSEGHSYVTMRADGPHDDLKDLRSIEALFDDLEVVVPKACVSMKRLAAATNMQTRANYLAEDFRIATLKQVTGLHTMFLHDAGRSIITVHNAIKSFHHIHGVEATNDMIMLLYANDMLKCIIEGDVTSLEYMRATLNAV